jgi:hypothetical protein
MHEDDGRHFRRDGGVATGQQGGAERERREEVASFHGGSPG